MSRWLDCHNIENINNMIKNDLSLWEFTRQQPDFQAMKLTFKIFRPFIKNWDWLELNKVLEYLGRHRPQLYFILNKDPGRQWFSKQITIFREELKKI